MVIQKSTVRRVEEYLKELRRKPGNKHLTFKCHQSKTSVSLYIDVISYVGDERIKLSYRLSDHRQTKSRRKVKSKIVGKNTKFEFIKRKIDAMVKQMEKTRYYKLCKLAENKKKKEVA